MIFLYSGASVPDAQQPDPAKSLGGYASKSLIPNGFLTNIFSTITKTTVNQNQKEIRLIVLKNLLSVTATAVRIWSVVQDAPTGFSKVKLAAVAPATDPKCGFQYFETVFNDQAIPYQATLDYHEGEANAIVVGDIAPNAMIGIWIQRELNMDSFTVADGKPSPPSTALPQGSGSACTDEAVAELEAQAENPVREDVLQLIVDYV